MSLKFRHGLPTSSLASRDPYAQYRLWRGLIPAITHSSTPSSNVSDHINRRHNPTTTTTTTPFYFPNRPPITFIRRTESQRKHSKRKALYLHRSIPRSTPNPRCARFRLWYKDARVRRRQLKSKVELLRQAAGMISDPIERACALFTTIASLHRISVTTSAQSPQPSRKRKRIPPEPDPPPIRSFIGPLTPLGSFYRKRPF